MESRVDLKNKIHGDVDGHLSPTSHNGGKIIVKLLLKDSVSNETSELMTKKKNTHTHIAKTWLKCYKIITKQMFELTSFLPKEIMEHLHTQYLVYKTSYHENYPV